MENPKDCTQATRTAAPRPAPTAEVREAARSQPIDAILVETDAPYLAPIPFRGKRNEPAYVPLVAAEIARLRGETVETIARATSDNYFRLFGITTEPRAHDR